MERAPLVSIGLPTYNRAASLRRAADSVLAQGFASWELVICDNASADGTGAVCAELAARDSRVRCVRHPRNIGATANFVSALRQARGEYFLWLADDDWLGEGFLAQCVAVLQEDPQCALVCGRVRYFRDGQYVYQSREFTQGGGLVQSSPGARVLSFYGGVEDNGVLYGLIRRQGAARGTQLRNVVGGDWLFTAATVFAGTLRTMDTCCINRSLGGASGSVFQMAASLGVGKWQTYFPHLALAWFAAQDIAAVSPAYGAWSTRARRRLAWQCARIVVRRFALRSLLHVAPRAAAPLVRRFAPGAYGALHALYRRGRALYQQRYPNTKPPAGEGA